MLLPRLKGIGISLKEIPKLVLLSAGIYQWIRKEKKEC
jgi:hypothetical protein